jgi:membrane-associated protease RseP (regulator of RpoE activity)
MGIGKLRWGMVVLGALGLVTTTARCGSAQEQAPKPEEEVVVRGDVAAPFIVRSGMGGGSYLGVYISEVDAEDAGRLELDRERGALIERVSEGGPAEAAGLENDDVIIGWNGSPVESAAQLQRLVRETPAGREVTLELFREGRRQERTVTIGERESLARTWSFRTPDLEQLGKLEGRMRRGGEQWQLRMPELQRGMFAFMGGGRLGVGIQSVGDQLGEYFGLGDRTGVLVTSVNEDSPAEKAGLKAGDIILSVNGEDIDGTGDLARKVREADEGPTTIGLLRDKRERTITVELPEVPEFEWNEAPEAAILSIPEAVEGAMLVVPEILENLELPDLDVEVRSVPEAVGPVKGSGIESVRT